MRILVPFVLIAAVGVSHGQDLASPPNRFGIGVEQRLGAQIPLDAPFVDETGRKVVLGEYFKDKPVVLIPIWYRCQGICLAELEGTIKAIKGLKKLELGRDFVAVTFSLHPGETTEHARAKKAAVIDAIADARAVQGWHFLTGDAESIRRLTESIGYKFTYYPDRDAVDHPACIVVLTPEGKTSQYFIDVNYVPLRVNQALIAAKANEVGKPSEPRWFGCIVFDPNTGKYTVRITRILQLLCGLTVLTAAGWIGGMSIKHRLRARKEDSPIP